MPKQVIQKQVYLHSFVTNGRVPYMLNFINYGSKN